MKKIKKYIKNKIEINDFKIKWKVKPNWNKKKCSASIEISKSIDNVEFYAVIEGKPFLIAENGIGIDNQLDATNNFSANFKVTTKF